MRIAELKKLTQILVICYISQLSSKARFLCDWLMQLFQTATDSPAGCECQRRLIRQYCGFSREIFDGHGGQPDQAATLTTIRPFGYKPDVLPVTILL